MRRWPGPPATVPQPGHVRLRAPDGFLTVAGAVLPFEESETEAHLASPETTQAPAGDKRLGRPSSRIDIVISKRDGAWAISGGTMSDRIKRLAREIQQRDGIKYTEALRIAAASGGHNGNAMTAAAKAAVATMAISPAPNAAGSTTISSG